MGFTFRLETVLKVRERERDACRAALNQAFEALQILHDQSEQIQNEIDELRNDVRQESSPGRVNVDRLMESGRYEFHLRSGVATIDGRVKQVEEEIERRRVALEEANRQVKVLEKLRQRQYDAWVADAAKRETAAADEVAVQRYGMGSSQ